MQGRFTFLAGLVVGFILAILLATLVTFAGQPICPQEDSCKADYFDGSWHIVKIDH